MRTCPQCHKVYSDLVKVCPDCKVPLPGAGQAPSGFTPRPNPVPARPVPPQPFTPQPVPPQPVPPQPAPRTVVVNPAPTHQEAPGFGKAVKLYFTHYADFKTRSRRREFWYATLFMLILTLLVYGLITFGAIQNSEMLVTVGSILFLVLGLATIIPSLALSVRRLHDSGKSGWFYLLNLIPYIGSIILFVFFCLDSAPDNQWGPNPKA